MKIVATLHDCFLRKKTIGFFVASFSVFAGCALCYLAGAYVESGEFIVGKLLLCVLAFIVCALSCTIQFFAWTAEPRTRYGKLEISPFIQLLCIDLVALLLCFAVFGPIGLIKPESFIAVSKLAPGTFVFLFLLVAAVLLVAVRAKTFSNLSDDSRAYNRLTIREPFLPWFLAVYFLLLIAPYSFAPIPTINYFLTGSGKTAYRLVCLALLGLYSLYLSVRYKLRPRFELLLPFALFFLSCVVSCFLSPRNICYVSEGLNGSFLFVQVAISEKTIWTELARALCSFFVLFCFVSFFAPCVRFKKDIFIPMLVILIYALLACLYSYVFEYPAYKSFLTGADQSKGAIISWSQSKNSFGIILSFGAFSSSFIFCAFRKRRNIIFAIFPFLFLATSYFCQCYSSLVVVLFVCLLLLVLFFVWLSKKSKPIFWAFSATLALVLTTFLLFVSIPAIYENVQAFKSINEKIGYFLSQEIFSRTKKWSQALVIIKGPFSFVGKLGSAKAELTAFESINEAAAANDDFHSAFVDFLACKGLTGLIFYLFFIGYAAKNVWRLLKKSRSLCGCMFALLVCAVLFSMPETYSLFLSMSVITIPFTYAFVLFIPTLERMTE